MVSSLSIINALSSVLSNIATVLVVPALTSNLAPGLPPTPTLPAKVALASVSNVKAVVVLFT